MGHVIDAIVVDVPHLRTVPPKVLAEAHLDSFFTAAPASTGQTGDWVRLEVAFGDDGPEAKLSDAAAIVALERLEVAALATMQLLEFRGGRPRSQRQWLLCAGGKVRKACPGSEARMDRRFTQQVPGVRAATWRDRHPRVDRRTRSDAEPVVVGLFQFRPHALADQRWAGPVPAHVLHSGAKGHEVLPAQSLLTDVFRSEHNHGWKQANRCKRWPLL